MYTILPCIAEIYFCYSTLWSLGYTTITLPFRRSSMSNNINEHLKSYLFSTFLLYIICYFFTSYLPITSTFSMFPAPILIFCHEEYLSFFVKHSLPFWLTHAFLCFKAFNRWGYYPLILIGSWSFATINRVYDFINPNHRIFWLSFLDVGFAGLMVHFSLTIFQFFHFT